MPPKFPALTLVLLHTLGACSRSSDGALTDLPIGAPQSALQIGVVGTAAASSPRAAPPSLFVAPAPTTDAEPDTQERRDDGDIEWFDVPAETIALPHFTEVRAAPGHAAALLGVLAPGVRVAVHPTIPADDCTHGWRAIEPRGYICGAIEPTAAEPTRELLPRVPTGALVPGVHGKLRSEGTLIFADAAAVRSRIGRPPTAALTVRRLGTVSIDGAEYWRTRHGLVAAAQIRKLDSSGFRGLHVDDGLETPLAWARFRGDDGTIALRMRPAEHAPVHARMRARDHARVVETEPTGRWVRLDRGGWARRDEVRIASVTTPPSGVADDERWLDIDVDEQVLVAYVGARPVYATLVSTGRRTHDTPTGIFRIERKVAERTMSSRTDDDEPYAVDRVPWTAYFIGSYALHTAYWHGSFGERKSHGCVNLSPRDARRLYGWTAPGVLPGYTEIHGSAAQPGAVIRIRSAEDPSPAWQGYAAAMRDDDGHG